MNIFANSMRLIREQARREFQQSEAGKLLAEVQRLPRGGRISPYALRQVSRQVERLSMRGVLSQLRGSEFGGLIGDVERYAGRNVVSTILRELGPLGSFLESLIRPRGRAMAGVSGELAAAANLLKAFGFTVQAPDRRPAAQRRSNSVADARALLESLGFTVTPPGKPKTAPPKRSGGTRRKKAGSQQTWTVAVGGRQRTYAANDPAMTGEMIEVESSNVHSIGYIWNWDDPMKGTLQVRFLQSSKGQQRKSAGPLYYYYGVHPEVFEAFQRAASKGEFVWDRLRVRGTVSGHRFHYDLKGVTGGYVPRKATRYGQNEYFIRRSVRARDRDGNIHELESELADERVGSLERGIPNRGIPDRGVPDRGTPNRGR